MILLSPVAEVPILPEASCHVCGGSVSIQIIQTIDTRGALDSLLNGTLNTADCPSCGTSVSAEKPVHIDLPGEPAIHHLGYAPLDLLDQEIVCRALSESDGYRHIFYSFDELARQVRARLRLHNFQSMSRQTTSRK